MGLIKKALNLFNESLIYYELDGDNHTYSVNLLSYIFKRNDFLRKDKKRFIIKDNVRYIHFKNFMINGIIDAPNTGSVRITDRFDKFGNIHVLSKDFIQLNFKDDNDKLLFSVTSIKAKDVSYSSYIKEVRVVDAESVDISGSSCFLDYLNINSKQFSYHVSNNNIGIINYKGDDLSFSNSRGIIRNISLSDVEHLNIKNCSLESEDGYFNAVAFCGDKIIASYLGGKRFSEGQGEPKVNYPKKFLVFDLAGNHLATLDVGIPMFSFCYDADHNRIIMAFDNEIQFGYLDLDGLL